MNAESISPTATNINEAIDWLQKTGVSIQDFAVEQAPLYCREVVAWEFWSSICWIALGAILLTAGIIPLVWGCKRFQEKPWCDESCPPILGGGAAAVVAIIIVCSNTPQAIKACVAPRLIIVEHLRGLNK